MEAAAAEAPKRRARVLRENETLKDFSSVRDNDNHTHAQLHCNFYQTVLARRNSKREWKEEDYGMERLNDFEQQEDENDGEDERESAAAVVAEAGTHAVTAKAEDEDQDNQKNKHGVHSAIEMARVPGR
jgi:hypothetical protein